jgi:hypothetical protein
VISLESSSRQLHPVGRIGYTYACQKACWASQAASSSVKPIPSPSQRGHNERFSRFYRASPCLSSDALVVGRLRDGKDSDPSLVLGSG